MNGATSNRYAQRAALVAFAGALFALPSFADTIAIEGATVHTLGDRGTLDNATVLVAGGVITAIGTDIDVPDEATRIDASGKIVTPGLFDPYSYLGLAEIGLDEASNDRRQNGTQLTASFDVADAINPHSTLIDVNRVEGVTRALVVPALGETGSVISGLAAVIGLGDPQGAMRRGAALIVHLNEAGSLVSGGSRALSTGLLREALAEAVDYRDNAVAWAGGQHREYTLGRPDLEALQPVIDGRIPVIVNAHRASDIRVALDLADRFGLDIVIAGGAESWMVADELAAADVAVILDPLANLPSSLQALGARADTAALLYRAGVTIAFTISDSHNARNLAQSAGNAVAEGLPWEEGLAAVTRAPAQIFGLHDRFGTLETGKAADIVVWDGDPLEVTTFADHVLIEGRPVNMRSRQILLRDRYLEGGGDWPPAYRVPRP